MSNQGGRMPEILSGLRRPRTDQGKPVVDLGGEIINFRDPRIPNSAITNETSESVAISPTVTTNLPPSNVVEGLWTNKDNPDAKIEGPSKAQILNMALNRAEKAA